MKLCKLVCTFIRQVHEWSFSHGLLLTVLFEIEQKIGITASQNGSYFQYTPSFFQVLKRYFAQINNSTLVTKPFPSFRLTQTFFTYPDLAVGMSPVTIGVYQLLFTEMQNKEKMNTKKLIWREFMVDVDFS